MGWDMDRRGLLGREVVEEEGRGWLEGGDWEENRDGVVEVRWEFIVDLPRSCWRDFSDEEESS